MKTDSEIRQSGYRALANALGEVEAERFITLILREPFDYTTWQRNLWKDRTVQDMSESAMELRRSSAKPSD